jgi:hypothetical protein
VQIKGSPKFCSKPQLLAGNNMEQLSNEQRLASIEAAMRVLPRVIETEIAKGLLALEARLTSRLVLALDEKIAVLANGGNLKPPRNSPSPKDYHSQLVGAAAGGRKSSAPEPLGVIKRIPGSDDKLIDSSSLLQTVDLGPPEAAISRTQSEGIPLEGIPASTSIKRGMSKRMSRQISFRQNFEVAVSPTVTQVLEDSTSSDEDFIEVRTSCNAT